MRQAFQSVGNSQDTHKNTKDVAVAPMTQKQTAKSFQDLSTEVISNVARSFTSKVLQKRSYQEQEARQASPENFKR